MKKLVIFAIALLSVLACFQNSYAKTYYRTFEVAEITSEGIVLKDFEGGRFLVKKDPSGYKVGEIVRYDTVREVLKKAPWQPAKVIEMNSNTVKLELHNKEQITINMKSHYRGQFTEGDTVQFKASTGQIKKSNLTELQEVK
jgi:hypothetical protein